MAKLVIRLSAKYGAHSAAREVEYEAADFEQANRAIPFAAEALGDVILEVLDKAGVRPEAPKGGEDHDIR